jgi:hypothetical protein
MGHNPRTTYSTNGMKRTRETTKYHLLADSRFGGPLKSHLASEDSILSAMSAACVTSGCCCGLHA